MRIAILFWFLLASIAWAQTGQEVLKEEVQDWSEWAAGEARLPGYALAIVKDGKPIVMKAFGKADCEKGTEFTVNTAIPLGSTGTLFNAIVALQMVERGELKLDGLVECLRPKAVTLRHILGQASGLEEFAAADKFDPGAPQKFDDLVDSALARSVTAGEIFTDTDSNWLVLKHEIERASGKKLDELLQSRIITPLKLPNANPLNSTKAKSYFVEENIRSLALMEHESLKSLKGFQMVASLADFVKFDQAVNAGQLLKKETWALASTPVKLKNGESEFGLGFDVTPFMEDLKWFGRAGGIDGFVSSYIRVPSKKLGIIFLGNAGQVDPILAAKIVLEFYLADEDLRANG